jgi:hypothetical protein
MGSHAESRLRREQRRLHGQFLRNVRRLLRLIELPEKARLLREKGAPDAPSDAMIRETMRPLVERIEAARTELDRLAQAHDWRRQPRPKRRKSYKLGMLVRNGSPQERRQAGFRLLQRLRGLRSAEAARKRGRWNFEKVTP